MGLVYDWFWSLTDEERKAVRKVKSGSDYEKLQDCLSLLMDTATVSDQLVHDLKIQTTRDCLTGYALWDSASMNEEHLPENEAREVWCEATRAACGH